MRFWNPYHNRSLFFCTLIFIRSPLNVNYQFGIAFWIIELSKNHFLNNCTCRLASQKFRWKFSRLLFEIRFNRLHPCAGLSWMDGRSNAQVILSKSSRFSKKKTWYSLKFGWSEDWIVQCVAHAKKTKLWPGLDSNPVYLIAGPSLQPPSSCFVSHLI